MRGQDAGQSLVGADQDRGGGSQRIAATTPRVANHLLFRITPERSRQFCKPLESFRRSESGE